MKKSLLIWAALLSTGVALAQKNTDSTAAPKQDTIRIGGMVIIKSKGPNIKHVDSVYFQKRKDKKIKNIKTSYFVLDFGFSNFTDKTDYTSADAKNYARAIRPGEAAFTPSDLNLNNGKSIDFSMWFFMQRYNLINHVVNLKYGLGIETNNYRFDNSISFKKTNQPYLFRDSVSFTKNKLALDYITVPLMLNFNFNPHHEKTLAFSLGASLGYLYSSRNKQISGERGTQINHGSFDNKTFKISYIGELGLGALKLYGSYSPTSIFERGLNIRPFNIGIRLGGWD